RMKALIIWVMPGALLLTGAILALLEEGRLNRIISLVVSAGFAALWALIAPSTIRRAIDLQTQRLASESMRNGALGPHELELTEAGLVEKAPAGEQPAAAHPV